MNNKTPEEIVRLLRDSCSGCDPTPCCEFEVLGPAAADLIESLQSQLAESQRRERAAVDFIKYLDRNYSGYMAEDERFEQWRGPQAGKGEAE